MDSMPKSPNEYGKKIDWVLELQRERRAEDDAWNRKNGFPVNIWKDWTPEEQQAIADDSRQRNHAFYERERAARESNQSATRRPSKSDDHSR